VRLLLDTHAFLRWLILVSNEQLFDSYGVQRLWQ
jgi:PIN domain nuclease of toxin-antitoxin system